MTSMMYDVRRNVTWGNGKYEMMRIVSVYGGVAYDELRFILPVSKVAILYFQTMYIYWIDAVV